jgi:hypothetical protein
MLGAFSGRGDAHCITLGQLLVHTANLALRPLGRFAFFGLTLAKIFDVIAGMHDVSPDTAGALMLSVVDSRSHVRRFLVNSIGPTDIR